MRSRSDVTVQLSGLRTLAIRIPDALAATFVATAEHSEMAAIGLDLAA